ncbi:MAG: hypothetical protein SGJ18_01730 [Pseudomonadota bacterium]|nr:hypothetical protein [Pseudomonadota bacterium]
MVRLFLIWIFITVCGCEYSPFSSSTCKDGCPPQLFSSQSRQWDKESLDKISKNLTGFLESSVLGNHKAIWLDIPSQKLVLTMPSPNVFLDNWSTIISELPGTQVRAYVDAQQHSFVEVRYPLYLLSEKFDKFSEKYGLSNGELLPGITDGKLARIDIPMAKNFRAHLFFGKGVVALLVDVPYDPMLKTSLPIKRDLFLLEPENILGYVSTIPKANFEFGGIFMSAVIPSSTMALIR